ncbi:MAG: hypothetical protein JWQ09_40 [Segetibacter sp.]|nr:hypothetical protein [Segetibacter sp.]
MNTLYKVDFETAVPPTAINPANACAFFSFLTALSWKQLN